MIDDVRRTPRRVQDGIGGGLGLLDRSSPGISIVSVAATVSHKKAFVL
jgi:hypothetical protein